MSGNGHVKPVTTGLKRDETKRVHTKAVELAKERGLVRPGVKEFLEARKALGFPPPFGTATKAKRALDKKAWTFRKAWDRTIREPTSPDDFPTNLVGVQISQGVSKQQIVELPRDGEYYGCGRHSFNSPDKVFKYMGHYLCPRCGRPLKTWEQLQ